MTESSTDGTTAAPASPLGDLTQYQKHEEFPPDKAETWAFPPEKDGWVAAHNALRGELDTLATTFEKLTKVEEDWQRACLQLVWKHHQDHVKIHQTAEETIMEPFFATRFNYPEQASAGHKDLDNLLSTVETALQAVCSSDGGSVEALQQAFGTYATAIRKHFDDEEQLALPLQRAFFAQAEMKETGKRMGKEGGSAGSFVYYMGADVFRNEFMVARKMPFFVWYIAFEPELRAFQQGFIQASQALQDNVAPPAASGSSCISS